MKLQSRTILITGGTSGIGLELAKQLHERSNTVIVTGRNQERLDAGRRMLPVVHTFKSDVGVIAALHESVLAQFPALDTLINNAGIMRNLNINQARDLKDVTREIEINCSGPVGWFSSFCRISRSARALSPSTHFRRRPMELSGGAVELSHHQCSSA